MLAESPWSSDDLSVKLGTYLKSPGQPQSQPQLYSEPRKYLSPRSGNWKLRGTSAGYGASISAAWSKQY